jgi:hypothetical protein
MTTEIPSKSWDSFCGQLADWHRGTVSIQWFQPGGDIRMVLENQPLQTVRFEKKNDACSDTMTFEAGPPGEHLIKHQIREPFSVIMRKNAAGGHYSEMEILAESGRTAVFFSPGIEPAMVEKLTA